jgi:hypothetical protein
MQNFAQVEDIPGITRIVMKAIGITFVLGVLYDVIAYACGGNAATLSKAMQQIGFSWPIIIFAYGGLGAHFFCPDDGKWMGFWSEAKPYFLMCAGMLIFRIAWPQVIQATN